MNKRKPAYDFLPEDTKKKCLDRIISYFLDEYDLEIGIIAAEQIIELLEQDISKAAYNKALSEAQKLLQQKHDDLEADINLLKIS